MLKPWDTIVSYETEKYGMGGARISRIEPSLMEDWREARVSTIPQEYKDEIDKFHRSHNATSPNTNDIAKRRHPLYPRQIETARRIYRMETWVELWAAFRKFAPHVAEKIATPNYPNECPTILRREAPWELVKGTDSGCLCTNCEGTNALCRGKSKACSAIDDIQESLMNDDDTDDEIMNHQMDVETPLQDNDSDDEPLEDCLDEETAEESLSAMSKENKERLAKIARILKMNSKREMCEACLQPCLGENGLEDAKPECENGTCVACGFGKLWSRTLRKSLFETRLTSEGQFETVLRDNLDPKWTETIQWRYYVYKEKSTMATVAAEAARQADAIRNTNPDAEDEDYSNSGSNSARNLVLLTKTGNLIDFLDAFEARMELHIKHRVLVSQEARAKRQFENNKRPFMISRDIDFSENGSIENLRKLQSEHWTSTQYTLFVAVYSFLLSEEWNKTEGSLTVGDEVTVNGELAGETINPDSFWGRVKEKISESEYMIVDFEGGTHNVKRENLRHRVLYTIACGGITDDKKHDKYAMQHFTFREIKYVEEYMSEKFPQDLPTGKIERLFTHSDNATQHFKNTGAMWFYTSLVDDEGHTKWIFVYCFGAPGHGKGKWDGIGGGWKNLVKSLIQSHFDKGDGVPGVLNGLVLDANDVYDALVYHYQHNWRPETSRTKSKNPVRHHKFFLSTADSDPIQRPANETFEHLEKITSNYEFVVAGKGGMYTRPRTCFCMKCIADLFGNRAEWGAMHYVPGCSSASNNKDSFQYTKRLCTKTAGVGVSKEYTIQNRSRREMARDLKPYDWVILDGDDDVQPIWLGRAMPKIEWHQSCIWVKQGRGNKDIQGLIFGQNAVAINVIWYERTEAGDHLTYQVTRGNHGRPLIQHHSQLLHASFTDGITQVEGTESRRIVPRRATGSQYQETEGRWYSREITRVWKMSPELYEAAVNAKMQ